MSIFIEWFNSRRPINHSHSILSNLKSIIFQQVNKHIHPGKFHKIPLVHFFLMDKMMDKKSRFTLKKKKRMAHRVSQSVEKS